MRNRGITNVTVAVVPNLHLFSSRRVNEKHAGLILSARAPRSRQPLGRLLRRKDQGLWGQSPSL